MDTRLGSVELLPMYVLLQYTPAPRHAVRPYIGTGVNLTICWEKSGALDSSDLTPGFGPVIQLGSDFGLSETMMLNADLRWNYYRADLKRGSEKVATLSLDTATLGAGLGFRF